MARKKTGSSERIVTVFIAITLLVAVLSLAYVSKAIFFPKEQLETQEQERFTAITLTPFDVELAKKFMDKDNDGKCDSCGMDVEFCIQGGQLQCNMDAQSTIGVLDTTKKKHHYHADFKVFINGNELDFNQPKYFVRSRFVHVENDTQGDSGKVLHMHATGVPLWIFFESVGMKFDNGCTNTDDGKEYCDDAENTLKLYVNNQPNSQFGDYVFNDNDKILISYGNESEAGILKQLESVTDFAVNH